MRKAIKFCLALAMVGTMASVALADVTTSGWARFGLKSSTLADATGDNYSKMDMESSALVAIASSMESDGWTATAEIDLLVGEDYALAADWYSFTLAKDGMKLILDNDDLGNAGQGKSYAGYLDSYGKAGDHLGHGNTLVKVAMDMGLTAMIGINSETGSGYTQQDLGVSYAGAAGDISYAVVYQTYTKTIDEKDGGVPFSADDGATGSDMGIGVGMAMGTMGFNFAYGTKAETPGGLLAVETAENIMQLGADIGLGDDTGITVVYDTTSQTVDGENTGVMTNTYVAYKAPMLGCTLSAAYYSTTTTPEGGDALTTGAICARLQHSF